MSGAGAHVVVGLSGGVDSAVSAYLLKQQGYRVSGLFMVNWTDDEQGYCTAADDFQDARAVCEELQIPLHRVDFSVEYRERVFQHFLADYAAGKTPNPDLLCNREVKFHRFASMRCAWAPTTLPPATMPNCSRPRMARDCCAR
jgi:tRNA-specific 2-thiouridylase